MDAGNSYEEDETKSMLDRELSEKLERLLLIYEQPALFLTEYFAQSRNKIDFDTEKLLCDAEKNDEKKLEINTNRDQFIRFLYHFEEKLLNELPERTHFSDDIIDQLKHRVEQFIRGSARDYNSLFDLEDANAELASDLNVKSLEIKKKWLRNQTITYIPTESKFHIGNLLYLSEYFLSHEETDFLNDIDKPIVVDRKFLLMSALKSYFSKIVSPSINCLVKPAFNDTGLVDIEYKCIGGSIDGFIHDFLRKFPSGCEIEQIDLREALPNMRNKIELIGPRNRIRKFQVCDSIAERLETLDLNENQMDDLDAESFRKCANLEHLTLTRSFLPETKFSLDFIASLSKLYELRMTLPDAPVDFGVFETLVNLTQLELHSAASLDCNIKRQTLTTDAFTHLSSLGRLEELHLGFFEIEYLDQAKLGDFKQLQVLLLDDNLIGEIRDGAFELLFRAPRLFNKKLLRLARNSIQGDLTRDKFRGLTDLKTVHFRGFQIERMSAGFLAEVERLVDLELTHTSIREITRGTFEGLGCLKWLTMDHNPIEAVEANSFEDLSSLIKLSMRNCKLKSINGNMFNGLQMLGELLLDNNEIESFHVTTASGDVVLSDVLRPEELKLVQDHMFCDMKKLDTLSMQGNQLRQLDLNLFCNLIQLSTLDLSRNDNVELKQEIQPNTLTKLRYIRLNNIHVPWDQRQVSVCDMDPRTLEHALKEHTRSNRNLNRLILKNNGLEDLQELKLGKTFLSIEELDLEANCLKSIERGWFDGLQKLKCLSLAGNLIETVLKENFSQEFKNLEKLNLGRNKLSRIHSRLFSNLLNLRQLNLSENNIASFDLAYLFRSCRLLRCLDLSNNQLDHESINETSMSGVSAQNLKELMLANNRLERMDFVRNLYRLEKLNLSGNKIESVTSNGVNFLGRLVKLSHVNLSNNRIESLNVKAVFTHLINQLEFIDLTNNPFDTQNSCKADKDFHVFYRQYLKSETIFAE